MDRRAAGRAFAPSGSNDLAGPGRAVPPRCRGGSGGARWSAGRMPWTSLADLRREVAARTRREENSVMRMPTRYRAGAFRRHRRHRHERHRRGAGQSRLSGAGLRRRRERQCPAPEGEGRRRVAIGHDAANLGDARVVVVSSAIKASNPELEGGPRAAAAGGAPRGDAGRADAAQERDRHRRHARQDDDHLDGGGAARCRRLRPDRHQWRHHQCLRHQCPHGRLPTGWWSRPTRATAPSSSCRPTWRSSPISIPSISTTTARSIR